MSRLSIACAVKVRRPIVVLSPHPSGNSGWRNWRWNRRAADHSHSVSWSHSHASVGRISVAVGSIGTRAAQSHSSQYYYLPSQNFYLNDGSERSSLEMTLNEMSKSLKETFVKWFGSAGHHPKTVESLTHNGQREDIYILLFQKLANKVLVGLEFLKALQIDLNSKIESALCGINLKAVPSLYWF